MINLFIYLFVCFVYKMCESHYAFSPFERYFTNKRTSISHSLSHSLLHKPTPIIIHLFIVITIIIVIIMLWKEAKWKKKKMYSLLCIGGAAPSPAVKCMLCFYLVAVLFLLLLCVQFHCSLAGIFNIQYAACTYCCYALIFCWKIQQISRKYCILRLYWHSHCCYSILSSIPHKLHCKISYTQQTICLCLYDGVYEKMSEESKKKHQIRKIYRSHWRSQCTAGDGMTYLAAIRISTITK